MSARPILYERAGADGLCPSPVCWRTRIALALKGVEAERRPMRFADVEQLAATTGSRTVPVLAVDGRMIVDSDAIAAHLDATAPSGPQLMAGDAASVGADLERELGARIGPLVGADFQRRLLPEDRDYFKQSREARYGRSFEELETLRAGLELDLAFSLGRLEPQLEAHRYLGGDEVAWPDIVAYSYIAWIAFASPRSMPELVNPVRTWFERHDAEWRAICLEPAIPGAPDAEPAP
jgi:glutathione S-transferase